MSERDEDRDSERRHGLLKNISVRDVVIICALCGGLGTATGAAGANVFAPNNATLTSIRQQTDENAKQIKQLIASQALHVSSTGHPALLERVEKVERRLSAQEKDVKTFYSTSWAKLSETLGRIDARLSAIEAEVGRRR